MNDRTHNLDQLFDTDALERIPTPFVWTADPPRHIRIAVVGAGSWRESSTLRALRASGHRVRVYATAGALAFQWQFQPDTHDVIVLDCGEQPDAILPALELLRDQVGSIAIVLICDDDPQLHAEARRLSVDQVLERPVQPVALLAALLTAAPLPLRAQH